jgi:hypothetical protein
MKIGEKMSMKKAAFALSLLMAFGFSGLQAAQTDTGAGLQAASWMKLPLSARSAGMGNAFGAVGSDLASLDINPAGLAFIEGPQVMLMHDSWFRDVVAERVAGGIPMMGESFLGLGINYLSFGSIESYTIGSGGTPSGNGTLNPYGLQLDVAFAKKLESWLSAGFGVKYARQDLTSVSASTVGLDAGLLARDIFFQGLSLGFCFLNVGGQMDEIDVPCLLKLSTAYAINNRKDDMHSLNLALDGDVSLGNMQAMLFALGVEYWYKGIVALRVGDRASNDRIGGVIDGLTLGAGLDLGDWRFDYGFMTNGDLGASHLVSLMLELGNAEPGTRETKKTYKMLEQLMKVKVQFEFDSAELLPSFAKQLDKFAAQEKKRPQDQLILRGYTDQQGSPEYNQKLSRERAEAVKARLVSRGVPASRITVVAKGMADPLVKSGDEAKQAPNRRVEIKIETR